MVADACARETSSQVGIGKERKYRDPSRRELSATGRLGDQLYNMRDEDVKVQEIYRNLLYKSKLEAVGTWWLRGK